MGLDPIRERRLGQASKAAKGGKHLFIHLQKREDGVFEGKLKPQNYEVRLTILASDFTIVFLILICNLGGSTP